MSKNMQLDGIELEDWEELTEDTLDELSDNKGDDEDE